MWPLTSKTKIHKRILSQKSIKKYTFKNNVNACGILRKMQTEVYKPEERKEKNKNKLEKEDKKRNSIFSYQQQIPLKTRFKLLELLFNEIETFLNRVTEEIMKKNSISEELKKIMEIWNELIEFLYSKKNIARIEMGEFCEKNQIDKYGSQETYEIVHLDRIEMMAIKALGDIFLMFREYNKAISYYIVSKHIAKAILDFTYILLIYYQLGYIYRITGKYDKSLIYYKKLLQISWSI